jgi:hypothetical protein
VSCEHTVTGVVPSRVCGGDERKTVWFAGAAVQVQQDELETDIELRAAVRSRCRFDRGTASWMITAITDDWL